MSLDWTVRNPNGWQHYSAFPEDYPKKGSLHYNIPPVRLLKETLEDVVFEPKYWHGYVGAKTFFTHQPLPSTTYFSVYGGTAPKRNDVNAYIPSTGDATRYSTLSTPHNIVAMADLYGAFGKNQPHRPQAHPIQVDAPDSRFWRFDGRNHTFAK
ncbi:unnamed protein product [Trichobilharzia regenti]|uniref:Sulfatase domain-containing protein n=1 Tax=Trichobilharzia regenti TaxID=157069 RepID=A0A183VRL8_TRIRE|nr:unnamed protein product [Trichobilharzia regenti]VDP99003.1 unnamed protein product [Trichobilharzia regenti]